eukprot:122395-Amphidinium_carterae.1
MNETILLNSRRKLRASTKRNVKVQTQQAKKDLQSQFQPHINCAGQSKQKASAHNKKGTLSRTKGEANRFGGLFGE